jgi:hypothetical protein
MERIIKYCTMLVFLGLVLLTTSTLRAQSEMQEPSKVASSIQQLLEKITPSAGMARMARPDLSNLSNDLLHVDAAGRIELLFHAAGMIGVGEEKDLEALGAEIVIKLESYGMIQAWVPYDKVEEAASLGWVVAVTPPDYGHVNVGSVTSEGVQLHHADIAQSQGVDGAGVTVGVISNGVANLAASQATGDLPTTGMTVLATGSGDEGTAMLEIVHDMAPGAGLVFHANGSGSAGHVIALQNLRNAGVNVIAEDLAFDAEPAFQQGVVAQARENTAAAGVAVHSSSGNRGGNHAARVQAVGTGGGPDGKSFSATPPGCAHTPDNVVAIAPNGDTTFDVTLGSATSITLQWSEPRAVFPTAGQGGFTDLNLYVMDAGLTQCLAQSVGVQINGVGDTIEQVFVNSPGTAAKIVVDVEGTSSAVAAPLIDLRWRGTQAQADNPTRDGSNDPDKNYTGLAFSIGAVNAGSGNLEGFSSAGPVDLVLTTICPGGAAGPCTGVAGPAAQQFQGLDFLGADGVSVTGVGGFGSPFGGTSAAAPHTAACDALVRQLLGATAAPSLIRARLAGTALDFPPPGEDSTAGAGQVDCFAALWPPVASCQDRTVPTDPGQCSASNVSIDNGSYDPGGSPVTLVQTPPSPYLLGTTAVTLTATDQDNLFTSCSAQVTVRDTEPPVITCPANITRSNDPGVCGAVATFTATARDNCSGVTVSCTPPSGSSFPVGTTTVTCSATDTSGNTSTCSFTVTVNDTEPPAVSDPSASPAVLWPPNHKMRDVTVNYTATDNCPGLNCALSVASNEPVNGTGDGDTSPDWEIVGANHVRLRAERAGTGNGRIYTITLTCTDGSGNTTTKTTVVFVAHNITAPMSGAAFKINTPVNFAGRFWDVPGKRHTAKWVFGSLSTSGIVTKPRGLTNGTVKGTYTFTTPGVFKITMKVTDNTGVTSSVTTAGDLEAIVVI